ncbi:esterase/lipase family protein [Aldersonia kunmingensis]|uniref:esterase/lipase family protein n=1 Tax=Aldersonia kunmingensis TaxID=408066 RepID=UPI00083167A3|nr:alpha/beta fold hydrolase [Aldersonia kunmingensis]
MAVVAVGSLASTSVANAQPIPEPVPGYNEMGPPPQGANDWNCKPSAAHPRPVVLVHGTNSSMQSAFPVLSPLLADEGYCVFALNYGGVPTVFGSPRVIWGLWDIRESARQLGVFIDAVLAHTGARQVDIVGHSQGGTMARQYLRFNGGADRTDPARNKVHSLVAQGPSNHGTTFGALQEMYQVVISLGLPPDLTAQAIFGLAGRQQLVGSRLLDKLNDGGETMPGVRYTVIASRNDSTITPPESSFLATTGPGDVRNVWVQDGCPGIGIDHSQLMTEPRPIWLVLDALDPDYGLAHPAPC